MTVLDPQVGEIYRVEVRKALATNPDASWVNTYEIAALDFGGVESAFNSTAELEDAGQAIVEWERRFHFASVLFTRLVISTWIADSEPYNGDEFLAVPLILSGTRVASGQPLGLNQCLYIERQPVGGRTGKLYFRGALTEDDVSAVAGQSNLESAFRTALNADLSDPDNGGDLVNVLAGQNNARLVMAGRNSADAVTLRRVVGLVASDRVVTKKTDNRWFNRTA